MHNLGYVALYTIMFFLDSKSMRAMALVCKKFRCLITFNPLLMAIRLGSLRKCIKLNDEIITRNFITLTNECICELFTNSANIELVHFALKCKKVCHMKNALMAAIKWGDEIAMTRILRNHMVDYVPTIRDSEYYYMMAMRNPDIQAAYNVVRELVGRKFPWSYNTLEQTIIMNRPQMFKLFCSVNPEIRENINKIVFSCIKYNSVEILKMAHTYSGFYRSCIHWNPYFCAMAAKNNNLDMLKCLVEFGCRISSHTLTFALRSRNVEIIAFLVEKKCPLGSNIMKDAILSGDLNIVKFFQNMNKFKPLDAPSLCVLAAKHEFNDILIFLCDCGYIPAHNKNACVSILLELVVHFKDRKDVPICVKYIHKTYASNSKALCNACANVGTITFLEYFVNNFEPIDQYTLKYAIVHGNLDCVKFLIDHHCSHENDLCVFTVMHGKKDVIFILNCIAYLHMNGHKFPIGFVQNGQNDIVRRHIDKIMACQRNGMHHDANCNVFL